MQIAGREAERDTPVLSLPSGTVTFLFTDIEGSTQLWAHNAQTMGAIARHEAILRDVIAHMGGAVFKTVGGALDAVQTALDGQRAIAIEPWSTSTPLLVRLALHGGVLEARGGDYFGVSLSRIGPSTSHCS